ncbi:heterokaryon incompatibility protein [Paraphaeosphaeria sporulosa]
MDNSSNNEMSSIRRRDFRNLEFRSWLQTGQAGAPLDELLCDVAGKLCSGHVLYVDSAKNADCDHLQKATSLGIWDDAGTKHSIDLYTDDGIFDWIPDSRGCAANLCSEQVAREYTFIRKVNYGIDRTFFRNSGVEGAKIWLRHCLSMHSICGSANTYVSLPTRLVAVGSSTRNPHLYITVPGEKGSYLALSYCWGEGDSLKTTSDTLDQLKSGFVLESLPKTCQEALVVARQLGVQYIWIDRLCIIQGDKEDWVQESASMCSVYANALLTLAALHSPECDAGLYTYSGTHAFQKATAISEIELLSGRKGTVVASRDYSDTWDLFFIHGPPATDADPRPSEYLESRLWTLQEIALSRRVLWFARGELGWSCKEGTACECYPQPTSMEGIDWLGAHITSNLAPDSKQDKKDWLPIWYRFIQEATQRLVTKDTDRLPAVAGMASAMKHHIGGRYIAGHWEADIEKSLLWEIEELKFFRYESTALLPPIHQYYAPSWSWASISRPMTHGLALAPDILEGKVDCKVIDIKFWPSSTDVNGPGLAILTMEAVVLAVSPPKSWNRRFEHKAKPDGRYIELYKGFSREWTPDPRGNQRPIRESDLSVAFFLRWPDDLEPNEVGSVWGLVLERVNEDEYKDWEAQLPKVQHQGSEQAETGLDGQKLRDLRVIHAEVIEGNVYRRVGIWEHHFRNQPWEEVIKDYQRQIHII